MFKLFICSVLSFAYLLVILFQSEYANGKDAYWFVIQLRSIIETGKFHSFEFSPLYILYFAIYQVFTDYIISFKITLAVLIFISFHCQYFLSQQFEKNRNAENVLLFSIFFSPSLLITGIQYPKQLFAIDLLLLAVSFYLKFLYSKKKIFIFISILCIALSAASHRLVFGIYLFSFIIFIFTLLRKRISMQLMALLCMLILFVFILLIFGPFGILHLSDFERLTKAFSISFSIPMLQMARDFNFPPLLLLESLSFFWFIFYFIKLSKTNIGNHTWHLNLFIVMVTFNLPLFDFYDLQIRLLLTANILGSLFYFKILNGYKESRFPFLKYSIIFILIENFIHLSFIYDKKFFENNYQYSNSLIQKSEFFLKSKGPNLLIAHKGWDKYFEFRTRYEVLAWSPDNDSNPLKVFRFVFNISKAEIIVSLKNSYKKKEIDSNLITLDKNYLIIREDMWNRFLYSSNETYDEELYARINHWKNPIRKRPAYLKNKIQF